MPKDPQERMTELEIQLAHVQRLYEQLNEVVTEQSGRIDLLERRCHQLQTQYKELKERQPESGLDPLDEKPPHY
jgi:SlyX protein